MGGHRSGKQLFLSWIYSSLTSARTQPVNITVGMLTWKLVSSLFILYLINIYGEAVFRVLCLLQTCSAICLVNLSAERDGRDCKLSMSKTKPIWPQACSSACVPSLSPWRHHPPKCSGPHPCDSLQPSPPWFKVPQATRMARCDDLASPFHLILPAFLATSA